MFYRVYNILVLIFYCQWSWIELVLCKTLTFYSLKLFWFLFDCWSFPFMFCLVFYLRMMNPFYSKQTRLSINVTWAKCDILNSVWISCDSMSSKGLIENENWAYQLFLVQNEKSWNSIWIKDTWHMDYGILSHIVASKGSLLRCSQRVAQIVVAMIVNVIYLYFIY